MTYQEQWLIGTDGERESKEPVWLACLDDDDDDDDDYDNCEEFVLLSSIDSHEV